MKTIETWDLWKSSPFANKIPETLPQDWEEVNLPHAWPMPPSGGRLKPRPYIYARNFRINEKTIEGRYYLHLTAAVHSASLFINGRRVGTHRGSVTKAVFDITRYLSPDRENYAVITVDGSERRNLVLPDLSRLKSNGLLGKVYLEHLSASHFKRDCYGRSAVFFSSELQDGHAMLYINAKAEDLREHTKLRIRLFSAQRESLIECVMAAGAENTLKLPLKNFDLWNVGEAEKYLILEASLLDGGKVSDRLREAVGIREVKISPDGNLCLNGEALLLSGLNAEAPDCSIFTDNIGSLDAKTQYILYNLSWHLLRCPLYPFDETLNESAAADGLVLMPSLPSEAPLGPDAECLDRARAELTEIIYQYYNLPSVLFWTLGSGLPDPLKNEMVFQQCKNLRELAYQLDPARPCALILDEVPEPSPKLKETADIFFIKANAEAALREQILFWEAFDRLRAECPELVLGLEVTASAETGSPAVCREHFLKECSERSSLRLMLHERELFCDPAEHENFSEGQGYLTFDDIGEMNETFELYKAAYAESPFIHIVRGGLPEREGPAEIKIYSNESFTELWLNGENLGRSACDGIVIYRNTRLLQGLNHIYAVSENSEDNLWFSLEASQDGEAETPESESGEDEASPSPAKEEPREKTEDSENKHASGNGQDA